MTMKHERDSVKETTLPLGLSGRPSGHDDDYPLDFAMFPGESARYGMGLSCILPMSFSHSGGGTGQLFRPVAERPQCGRAHNCCKNYTSRNDQPEVLV
jgi:hypothetical protein